MTPDLSPAASTPKRIQRQRTKGWRMPQDAVYVGRPTKWGNHHRVGAKHPCYGWPMSAEEAVDLFRHYVTRVDHNLLSDYIDEIRGKDLACWCSLDKPCHADVLLELANA